VRFLYLVLSNAQEIIERAEPGVTTIPSRRNSLLDESCINRIYSSVMFSLNLSRIISIFLSSSIINLSYATGTGIQWVQLSTKMPINVSDMVATPIGNQIIITGGCSTGNYRLNPGDINFYCTEITNAAFAFTPAAQTFKTLPSMPRERYRHAAAVVNNKLYVIGGRDIHDNFVSPVDVRILIITRE